MVGSRIFTCPSDSGAHSASYPMGIGASSLEIKQQGRETDHSPQTSADIKKTLIFTSSPAIRLHGTVLS
jgi:hypothetical protein